MTSSQEKGKELEDAVHAIESIILRQSPSFSDKALKIESRKIVVVDGVRHEIDILVRVELGPGYEAVFIFECKNWETAVPKNEIIVFSAKIDALQAQKGFFVASAFSKFARAQAKLDPRIELLMSSQTDPAEVPVPLDFHVLSRVHFDASLDLNAGTGEAEALDLGIAQTTLNAAIVDLKEYVQSWSEEIYNKRVMSFPSGTLAAGDYEMIAEDSRSFSSGQLVVNGSRITSADLRCTATLRVVRPAVSSQIHVETRGRVVTLLPVQIENMGTMTVRFIRLDKKS